MRMDAVSDSTASWMALGHTHTFWKEDHHWADFNRKGYINETSKITVNHVWQGWNSYGVFRSISTLKSVTESKFTLKVAMQGAWEWISWSATFISIDSPYSRIFHRYMLRQFNIIFHWESSDETRVKKWSVHRSSGWLRLASCPGF